MPAKFSDTLKRYAKGWLVLVFFGLVVLFYVIILPRSLANLVAASGDKGLIDELFFYTPKTVYSMIASYGDIGRTLYRTFTLTIDFIFPVVYTLFLSLLITWQFQRSVPATSKLQRLARIPFGALLFDILENLSIAVMLSIYPATPHWIAWLATLCTMLKWSFVGMSSILVLTGLVMVFKRRR